MVVLYYNVLAVLDLWRCGEFLLERTEGVCTKLWS